MVADGCGEEGLTMNARLYFSTDASTPVEPIEELSAVSLRKPHGTDGGLLPAGAEGTVVAVYGSGDAYCVEFEVPFHALVVTARDAIDPVVGASRADLARSLGTADR